MHLILLFFHISRFSHSYERDFSRSVKAQEQKSRFISRDLKKCLSKHVLEFKEKENWLSAWSMSKTDAINKNI